MSDDGRSPQRRANERLWSRTDLVPLYVGSQLRPAEALLLERFRDELAGSVLELGCGAGRVTGHLARQAGQLLATDVSPAMTEATARACRVPVQVLDLYDLDTLPEASYDAVVASFNVLDVLGHEDRQLALRRLRALLAPGGVLLFSSHDLRATDRIQHDLSLRGPDLLRTAARVVRSVRWRRNRRRLLAFEERHEDHAILNDVGHDWQPLHYYVDRDHCARQLTEAGLTVLDCLDLDGTPVPPGGGPGWRASLYYAARRPAP